jgi:uncharacterized membrane protein
MSASNKPQWLIYAIASGGCAALNGVFAKLTTTQLTTTWATSISHLFGMQEASVVVEGLVRGVSLPHITLLPRNKQHVY